MVCCLERAACGGVTELWRNQGNEIFLRAFFTIVAGFPAGDVMTVLPRVQFTCTKYPTIIVCGMRNGMIEDVIKRTSGMLSFFFSLFFSRNQSFPQQVRKFCPPPIRHTHHRADPFDPSVAPVLIPLPIVPRIVPPPSSLPHPLCHTTLLRISHPITTTLPSHFSSISTLSRVCARARACMYMYAACDRACSHFDYSRTPPNDILTIFPRFSSLSLPHHQTSNKSRKESFVVIASICR